MDTTCSQSINTRYTDGEVSFSLAPATEEPGRLQDEACTVRDPLTTDDDAASVHSDIGTDENRDVPTDSSLPVDDDHMSKTTISELTGILKDVVKEMKTLQQSHAQIQQKVAALNETSHINATAVISQSPSYTRTDHREITNHPASFNTGPENNVQQNRRHQAGDRNCCNNVNDIQQPLQNPQRASPEYDVRDDGALYNSYVQRYQAPRARANGAEHVKIPPFTGKEAWDVWITRFETIARRYGWNQEEKLNHLLPCIDGEAAHFVYSQLTPIALDNYNALVREMQSRFRVIETPRAFATMFSRRMQRHGESVESYAAELKRLYDKGHGCRDSKIRDEDLVRRFLDGLLDEEARFEVEFHKDPTNIDDAVFHIVNFQQTKRPAYGDRKNKHVRQMRDDLEEDHVFRVPESDSVKKQVLKQETINQDTQKREKHMASPQEELLKQILERLENLEQGRNTRRARGNGSQTAKPRGPKECYNCHKSGHFARNCPDRTVSENQTKPQKTEREMTDDKSSVPLNGQGPTFAARRGST